MRDAGPVHCSVWLYDGGMAADLKIPKRICYGRPVSLAQLDTHLTPFTPHFVDTKHLSTMLATKDYHVITH